MVVLVDLRQAEAGLENKFRASASFAIWALQG
jgi:hypothetical protein